MRYYQITQLLNNSILYFVPTPHPFPVKLFLAVMPAPVGAAFVPPVKLQVPPVMLLLSNHSSIAFTVGASKLLLEASMVFTLFISLGMLAAVALLLAITNASMVLKTPGVTGVKVMVFMPGVVYVC